MAGKEFKAKERTVQKMSRDGLVEENLRTGKTRKARIAADPGERIGDRPMEEYSERHSSVPAADDEKHLRFNRRDEAGELNGEVRMADGTRVAADLDAHFPSWGFLMLRGLHSGLLVSMVLRPGSGADPGKMVFTARYHHCML